MTLKTLNRQNGLIKYFLTHIYRGVPFLNERREVLETFIFSKLWYLAQILLLPQGVAAKATSLKGAFLWRGHGERLAWQELHNRRKKGGLAVSCVFTRGQALLAKQMCLQVAAGGIPAAHLAFWLGAVVGHFVPSLVAGSHAPPPPPGPLLAWCRQLRCWWSCSPMGLSLHGLVAARAASICRVFMDTPPPGGGQVALGLEQGLETAVGLWAAPGHGVQDVSAPSQRAAPQGQAGLLGHGG
jgi:hypothetical protein